MMKAPGFFTDSTTAQPTRQVSAPPLIRSSTSPNMLQSLQLLLVAGAAILPFAAAQADLVGTWSTKSHSVFTGPVRLGRRNFVQELELLVEKSSCVYQIANDHSRGFMIQSTKRCSNHSTLASRIHLQPMGSMRKHITELSQIVRAFLYRCWQ